MVVKSVLYASHIFTLNYELYSVMLKRMYMLSCSNCNKIFTQAKITVFICCCSIRIEFLCFCTCSINWNLKSTSRIHPDKEWPQVVVFHFISEISM